MMFRGSANACPPSWPAPPGSDVGGDDRGGGDGAFSGSSTASEVLMFCGSTASSIPGGVAHQEDLEKYDMFMFPDGIDPNTSGGHQVTDGSLERVTSAVADVEG